MKDSNSRILKEILRHIFALVQIQARKRQQKLKLILISSIAVAGLAIGGLWADNTVASNASYVSRSAELKNSFSGKVERYLLNPEGLVDGLMLNNNLQVKFPPHLANNLVVTVKPGDSVTVLGDPGIPSEVGQEIHAFSITNTTTQRTVVDQPPAYPPPPPGNNYSNLSVEGTVQYWLVGHRGEIRGIILSSSAQVRFPPNVGDQLFNIAKRGDAIQAQGFGTSTRYGQVLEATSLTVNGQSVNFYPEGPWRGLRHKKPF